MTYEEYETINDKHCETCELMDNWTESLKAIGKVLDTVQWEKDTENFQKLEEMTNEIRVFVSSRLYELNNELDSYEAIMKTSEYKATRKAYEAA